MPLWGPSVTVARSDLAAVFCLHICQIHREICGLFNEKFMSDRAISPAVYTYWPHMWRQLLNCVFEKPASTGYSVFDTVVATQKRQWQLATLSRTIFKAWKTAFGRTKRCRSIIRSTREGIQGYKRKNKQTVQEQVPPHVMFVSSCRFPVGTTYLSCLAASVVSLSHLKLLFLKQAERETLVLQVC